MNYKDQLQRFKTEYTQIYINWAYNYSLTEAREAMNSDGSYEGARYTIYMHKNIPLTS